jgi:hypothetical protein
VTDRQAKLEALKASAEALRDKAKTLVMTFAMIKARLEAAGRAMQLVRDLGCECIEKYESDRVAYPAVTCDRCLVIAAWDAAGIVKADQ